MRTRGLNRSTGAAPVAYLLIFAIVAAVMSSGLQACEYAPKGYDLTSYAHSAVSVDIRIIEQPATSAALCGRLLECEWRTEQLPRDDAYKVVPPATRSCRQGWDSGGDGRFRKLDCSGPDADSRLASVATIAKSIIGATNAHLCGANSPDRIAPGLVLQAKTENYFVMQVEHAKEFCLIVATNLVRGDAKLLYLPSCAPTSGSPAAMMITTALVATENQRLAIGAAGGNNMGFAIPMQNLEDGATTDAGVPIRWGWDGRVTGTLDRWLSAITVASKGHAPFAKSKDDPFPVADTEGFVGRISRWMISGMQQVSVQPLGAGPRSAEETSASASLRWMSKQELSRDPTFAETLLRGEVVRLDWAAP